MGSTFHSPTDSGQNPWNLAESNRILFIPGIQMKIYTFGVQNKIDSKKSTTEEHNYLQKEKNYYVHKQ
jgi:hypothetical protein